MFNSFDDFNVRIRKVTSTKISRRIFFVLKMLHFRFRSMNRSFCILGNIFVIGMHSNRISISVFRKFSKSTFCDSFKCFWVCVFLRIGWNEWWKDFKLDRNFIRQCFWFQEFSKMYSSKIIIIILFLFILNGVSFVLNSL